MHLSFHRRGELAEHAEEFFNRKANPKRQLKQRLFIMVIDELTSIRSKETGRVMSAGLLLLLPFLPRSPMMITSSQWSNMRTTCPQGGSDVPQKHENIKATWTNQEKLGK